MNTEQEIELLEEAIKCINEEAFQMARRKIEEVITLIKINQAIFEN